MGRLVLCTVALLMLSALSLVSSRYQARQLFVAMEREQAQSREYEVEWRGLQVERAALTSNARIDRVAGELQMVPATPERTLYLTESQIGYVADTVGDAQ